MMVVSYLKLLIRNKQLIATDSRPCQIIHHFAKSNYPYLCPSFPQNNTHLCQACGRRIVSTKNNNRRSAHPSTSLLNTPKMTKKSLQLHVTVGLTVLSSSTYFTIASSDDIFPNLDQASLQIRYGITLQLGHTIIFQLQTNIISK